MKIVRGLAVVVAGVSSCSPASALQASDAMKAIVGSYLEIHAQLATDKIDSIKAPATALATRAAGLGERRSRHGEGGEGRRRCVATSRPRASVRAAERRGRRRGESRRLEGPRRASSSRSVRWPELRGCRRKTRSAIRTTAAPCSTAASSRSPDLAPPARTRAAGPRTRRVPSSGAACQAPHRHGPEDGARHERQERPLPARRRRNDRQQPHADHRQQEPQADLQRQRGADVRPRAVLGHERGELRRVGDDRESPAHGEHQEHAAAAVRMPGRRRARTSR